MAILAGAIAPALIRYIDKSRKSNDISSAKTIKTAVETALGNENIYATLTNTTTSTVIVIAPGVKVSADDLSTDYMTITGCSIPDDISDVITADDICKEIGTNIGETMPKCKYAKAISADDVDAQNWTSDKKPGAFVALISAKGTVYVGVAPYSEKKVVGTPQIDDTAKDAAMADGFIMLTPATDKLYQ
jgi:type IV pilus assembly protein PilA